MLFIHCLLLLSLIVCVFFVLGSCFVVFFLGVLSSLEIILLRNTLLYFNYAMAIFVMRLFITLSFVWLQSVVVVFHTHLLLKVKWC